MRDVSRNGWLVATIALLLLAAPAHAVEIFALHTDHTGSVVAVTDINRNVVERYTYEPYGLPTTPIEGPGYTGHVHDQASGLVYMQQRYYDPAIGQFLSIDPIGISLTDGRNFSRYGYANANPYAFIDPDGRWPTRGRHTHQNSIERVIGPQVTRAELKILQSAQVAADAGQFQTGPMSFRHAMRTGGQSVADARAAADVFVREQFQRAWSAPDRETALIAFGTALHVLQDATSPQHANFQEWTGSESIGEKAAHVGGELYDPGANSLLDQVTESAWDAFQNGELPSDNLFGTGFQGFFRVEGRLDSYRLRDELKGH